LSAPPGERIIHLGPPISNNDSVKLFARQQHINALINPQPGNFQFGIQGGAMGLGGFRGGGGGVGFPAVPPLQPVLPGPFPGPPANFAAAAPRLFGNPGPGIHLLLPLLHFKSPNGNR